MPRNYLGTGGTKSMIGVQDGFLTVVKMRDAANAHPALRAVHQARQIKLGGGQPDTLLAKHHTAVGSLDSFLTQTTGEITRKTFPSVQTQKFVPFRSRDPKHRR